MLIVYGPRAKEAARSLKSQLHWYALGTLPENCAAEEDAAIAPSFAQLAHRDVVIWPEPGDAGRERAHRHARMIAQSGVTSAGVVAPHALDLGQPLPADVTPLMQRAWADEARDAARALALPALAGRGVRAVAPWPAPPSLALLHAETCTFLRRYLSEPGHAIETMALWCLHAWAARRERSTVDASPRLVLRGLDPRAEHARALRLIAWLTPAPLIVSRTIASHLLSAIEADKPTLLLDDVAGGILYRRDLRSLIAAGAARDGIFLTARNKRNESGRGQCFAPAAIATAAPLPEDLRLRSIVLPMAPATAGGARAQLTLLDPPGEALELRAKMQAWASTAGDAPAAFSMLPHSISTAARENWAVLMDIALKVGPMRRSARPKPRSPCRQARRPRPRISLCCATFAS